MTSVKWVGVMFRFPDKDTSDWVDRIKSIDKFDGLTGVVVNPNDMDKFRDVDLEVIQDKFVRNGHCVFLTDSPEIEIEGLVDDEVS